MDQAQAQAHAQLLHDPDRNLRDNAPFNSQYLQSRLAFPMDHAMILFDEERRWALELKEAFRNSSHFGDDFHLCDLFFAQHAMVAKGNIAEALVRIGGLYQFFKEYKIDHTPEQAMFFMREFMKQQPGYILHMNVSSLTQQAWQVTDSEAFRLKTALADDDSWKICICGIYYSHYTLWTTLTAMRQGLFVEIECDSVGWHNFNMEFTTRLFGELFSYMPIKFQTTRAYNTTVVANLLFSLARPFMSTSQNQSVQLGCQVLSVGDENNQGARRLSEFYLQPTVGIATERMLHRNNILLRVRKYHESTFRL